MVKTYDGNTGLETENVIYDFCEKRYGSGVLREATSDEQMQDDIDFFIGEKGVSVKEAKRAESSEICNAEYSTFAYEMRESSTTKIRNSWGINGKADLLAIRFKTRIVFYQYALLKKWAIDLDIPLRENRSSTIGKVHGCGRTYTSGHCKWLPIHEMDQFKVLEWKLKQ